LSNFVYVVVGNLIIYGSNILIYFFLARLLPVEEFATFRQLFLINSIISSFTISALPSCLLYFSGIAKNNKEKLYYIQATVLLTASISLVSILLLHIFSNLISNLFNNSSLEYLLPIFSFSILGLTFSLITPSILISKERSDLQIKLACIVALSSSLPVIFIALLGYGILEIVQLYSLIYFFSGVFLLIFYLSLLRDIELRFSLEVIAISKKFFLYSWPLLVAGGLSILGLKIDHIVISSIIGLLAYGIYSAGSFEIPVFNILQNSLSSVLLPKITRLIKEKDYGDAINLWKNSTKEIAWVTFPIALILILHSQEVMLILFGPKYIDASPIFEIFTLLVFIRVLSFSLVLRSLAKTAFELLSVSLYLITAIIGAYFFTIYYGMEGAALWVVINTSLLAIFIGFMTYKLTDNNINLFKVYPKKEFILAILIFCLVSYFDFLVNDLISERLLVISFNIILICSLWIISLRYFFDEKIIYIFNKQK